MHTETSFEKINSFVKDQVLFGSSPYIQQMPYGFKINGYMLKKQEGTWHIYNKMSNLHAIFCNRRVAILSTIMLLKSMNSEYAQLISIDKSLDIFQNDLDHYNYLRKKNPDNYVYQSRIDKIDQSMELIKLQLKQMEKSVNLQ